MLLFLTYVFVTPFAFPTFNIYCKSKSVNPLLFSHLPCIQFPQHLHNTACDIVFLPQMPYGSFLQYGFTVTCQILLTITFVFIRFTFRPLLSSSLSNHKNFLLFCHAPLYQDFIQYFYNIFCNMPSFISFVTTSARMAITVVIKLIHDVLQSLPQTLQKYVFQLSIFSLLLCTGSSLL